MLTNFWCTRSSKNNVEYKFVRYEEDDGTKKTRRVSKALYDILTSRCDKFDKHGDNLESISDSRKEKFQNKFNKYRTNPAKFIKSTVSGSLSRYNFKQKSRKTSRKALKKASRNEVKDAELARIGAQIAREKAEELERAIEMAEEQRIREETLALQAVERARQRDLAIEKMAADSRVKSRADKIRLAEEAEAMESSRRQLARDVEEAVRRDAKQLTKSQKKALENQRKREQSSRKRLEKKESQIFERGPTPLFVPPKRMTRKQTEIEQEALKRPVRASGRLKK
jgi:hypothetical protein